MSDNLPTEREMFEQWVRSHRLGTPPITDVFAMFSACWEGWQARAALASRPEPEKEIRLALKMIVSHWDEFGPEHGFDELIDRCARRALHQNEPVSVHQAKLSDDLPAASAGRSFTTKGPR